MYTAVVVQEDLQGRQELLEEGHSSRLAEVDTDQWRAIFQAEPLTTI